MVILEYPYVSDFMQKTIAKLGVPVLRNEATQELMDVQGVNLVEEREFIKRVRNALKEQEFLLYSNSENSIDWITNCLKFTNLPEQIRMFKDKVQFRKLLQEKYPNFYYQEVDLGHLEQIDMDKIKFPIIIKPAVGFFSLAVNKINDSNEWEATLPALQERLNKGSNFYPKEVINTRKLIIEEYLEGEEIAVDLYYDFDGVPVILNILKHLFSSSDDVKDRIYITSNAIIQKYYKLLIEPLYWIGKLAGLKGFPMHAEFKVDDKKNVVPIEVNPLRFAGWCASDLAYYAYDINVYQYFFHQRTPDWEEIFTRTAENKVYSIVIGDVPEDVNWASVKEVNYQGFWSYFERPLELRKMDYRKHGVFAFLFGETSQENLAELEQILQSNLKEYLLFN